jgi:hypothetical protein
MTNYSSYLDATGRPRLRSSVVAFLDLLGFSNAVTSATEEESRPLLDKIYDAIHDSRNYVRQTLGDGSANVPEGWSIKFFSDNLVLGYAYDDLELDATAAAWFVIRCVQRYQLRMAFNGLFLRGGLTLGSICLSDEIVFGKALIESYRLEESAAIVPRVVLSQSMAQVVLNSAKDASAGGFDARNALCRDVDGLWFVNYLLAAEDNHRVDWKLVAKHKESVLASLLSTTRHDILPKFGWACRYHNVYCHWHRNDPDYLESYRIDRTDERSIIVRLGEALAEQG